MGCSGANARDQVATLKRNVEWMKTDIWKNYGQMDLENADIQEEFETIVKEADAILDQVLTKLNSYTFE